MILRPFKATDIDLMNLQERQKLSISMPDRLALEQLSLAFTGIIGDEVVGCGGLAKQWEGRYIAWAFLAADLKQYFVPIHRAMKSMLDMQNHRRVEAYADVNFAEANRWLELLGFIKEGPPMKSFLPDGQDANMWVRLWQQ
jgi:hypothetical protein